MKLSVLGALLTPVAGPADPKHIMLERRFQHPLISPRAIAAARALRAHQGRGGLWFSGAYTTGADLQETALYSAMEVAGQLAPNSSTLTALRARIAAPGRRRDLLQLVVRIRTRSGRTPSAGGQEADGDRRHAEAGELHAADPLAQEDAGE